MLTAAVWFSCNNNKKTDSQTDTGPIADNDIRGYLSALADDSLTGRKPFTEGETKTINYLAAQFKQIGLEPANNSSYFQDVPLVEITGTPTAMQLNGKTSATLKPGTDFVASTRQELSSVEIKNSPLVFAGYGVVAPEYGWNDYKGLDVKGKTVVVLVNDPGFKSGNRTLFHGDTMTYYGRWTYKYEEAARQGAAGVLIVHQSEPASYPWSVVNTSFSGSKLYLQQDDKHLSRCKMEGWVSEETAKKLLAGAGITEDMRAYARKKEFKAVPLKTTTTISIVNKLKYSTSHNVAAVLKGSTRPDEYIIYTAHWDHLGIGQPDAKGDSIYNGAVDNASGTAALLAMAKAFKNAKEKPQRSIVFLSVTAEEQGLLGSEYYGSHPLFPLNKTVGNLNMDALSPDGESKDIPITGRGQNDLEDYVEAIAKEQGLTVEADPNPWAGGYYRSDHFNFAKVGVPALDMHTGPDNKEHGREWGTKQADTFNAEHYHQPSDNYTRDMDLSGMTQTANILYRIGAKLAGETTFPQWKKNSEFRAIREKSMAGK
ncbi:M28 family metallopeptidase [Mucilaginibacter defluvii]|uniref:M28 family metallopeptidase n=2 Tax=Mucilaginibacter defluvii TaxID=1196019 RepID=A0ABP9FVG1_9SPHI